MASYFTLPKYNDLIQVKMSSIYSVIDRSTKKNTTEILENKYLIASHILFYIFCEQLTKCNFDRVAFTNKLYANKYVFVCESIGQINFGFLGLYLVNRVSEDDPPDYNLKNFFLFLKKKIFELYQYPDKNLVDILDYLSSLKELLNIKNRTLKYYFTNDQDNYNAREFIFLMYEKEIDYSKLALNLLKLVESVHNINTYDNPFFDSGTKNIGPFIQGTVDDLYTRFIKSKIITKTIPIPLPEDIPLPPKEPTPPGTPGIPPGTPGIPPGALGPVLLTPEELKRSNEEIIKLLTEIRDKKTTPEDYVRKVLSDPSQLGNLKKMSMDHPAIYAELKKAGMLQLIQGNLNPTEFIQLERLKEDIRPYIVDGKYKVDPRRTIIPKIDQIKRKKYK